jgi:teichoic acid transport system permease protein
MSESQPTAGREGASATAASPSTNGRRPAVADAFGGERHVHEPHKVGIPPLVPYARTLWRRRDFAYELSRTDLRAQHFNTAFGQLWLVLNPLLLAMVYFLLVDILRNGSRGTPFFAHLIAGLFTFYFVQQSINHGAKSVVSGGRLILNTAFPRLLLPFSSVLTAFLRFVPTLVVYAIVHVAAGLPIGWSLLWALPILALFVILAAGLASFVAAAQVYFRDLRSFLPYLLRMWLYISPVLYYAHEVPGRYSLLLDVNPLAPLLTAWSDALTQGKHPSAHLLIVGGAWAVGLFVAGSLFFMSREREFAVRL